MRYGRARVFKGVFVETDAFFIFLLQLATAIIAWAM